jgi:hypothetical protein
VIYINVLRKREGVKYSCPPSPTPSAREREIKELFLRQSE